MNKYLILIIVTVILGCASKQSISGTIYISGNEPFAQLSLMTHDDTFYIIECSDELKKELWQLQGQIAILYIDKLENFETINIAHVKKYELKEKNETNK